MTNRSMRFKGATKGANNCVCLLYREVESAQCLATQGRQVSEKGLIRLSLDNSLIFAVGLSSRALPRKPIMAASGTNEHHEACRKQNFINRQTYMKKRLMAEADGHDEISAQAAMAEEISRKMDSTPGHLGPLSSYDLEKLHKMHGSSTTDEERRRAVRQSQYLTYTAKINGRLSSVNYQQQW